MVKIRKSKQAESLLTKPSREGVPSAPNSQPSIGDDQIISLDETLQKLPAAVFALASDDIKGNEAAVIYLRNLLSIERNSPIDAVIHSGAVPLLVDILRGDEIALEAAWALTNIVSGTSEHTKVVIDHGALPIFVGLLSSVHDNVREQAVWALGNIVGDTPAYRDLALAQGALLQLLAQFNETVQISMLRTATWTLSNFCRGKPQPQFDQIKNSFPALRWLIHMQDHEVLARACSALSSLIDGSTLNVRAVIDADICPKLVELLSHHSPYVVIPALETVDNIVAGDDVQTQAVINAQIFPPLLSMLPNSEFGIKKEATWAVSNATSRGSDEQIKDEAFLSLHS